MGRIQARPEKGGSSPDQQVELEAKARRRALLEAIRSNPPARPYKASDPARLIREDRRR
jgi:hypothetical protein